MMLLYVLIVVIAVVLLVRLLLFLQYQSRLKQSLKELYMNTKTVQLRDIQYQLLYVPCSKKTQIRVNSAFFIELMTPSQGKKELISVNLKTPTIVITSPIETQLRRVINENEEQFIHFTEKIEASYIVPIDQLATLKEFIEHA